MAYLNDTDKVYRIVIDEDPNSISVADIDDWNERRRNLRNPMSPQTIINLAKTDATKMYGSAPAAKGVLTRIKKWYPVQGWIEESDLDWRKI
jgi:hypothetical protein